MNFPGKYCCTNGLNNPNCEETTTPRPVTRTKLDTTTRPTIGTTRPTIGTTKKPFKGPTYLPLPTIRTTREPTTPDNYTWGSRGTNTYTYKWSFAPWSRDPRWSTVIYSTTPEPKYAYDGPSNGPVYKDDFEDNSV